MTGNFEILARDPKTSARLGRLHTAHGIVETPIFMPVGTQAAVNCTHYRRRSSSAIPTTSSFGPAPS